MTAPPRLLLADLLTEYMLHSRVRVLARELDNALPETTPKVLCIVDADFDYILDRIEENRFDLSGITLRRTMSLRASKTSLGAG